MTIINTMWFLCMVTPFKHLLLQERCKAPKVSGGGQMLSQIEIKEHWNKDPGDSHVTLWRQVMQILETPVRPLPTWKE